MPDVETAKRHFFEAVALLDAGDFAGGAKRLREALAFAPDNISILANLANALMMTGAFGEARAAAERVVARDAANLGGHVVLAECLSHEGRLAEAVDALDRIIALDPGVAEHHSNRSAALNRLRRHEEAIASADRALALKPGLAAAHLNRGNGLFGLRHAEEALAAYDKALASDRTADEAWTGRGNALAALGAQAEAIAAFDQALQRNPNAAHAWLGRGNALAQGKRFDDALAAFDRALAADPALADAWLGRGHALKEIGVFGKALEAYDRALGLGCDAAAADVGRGNVLGEIWRDQEALEAFDRAIAHNPDMAEAWFGRGGALEALKRPVEAIESFGRALEIAPETRFAAGFRLQAKGLICDWADWDAESAAIIAAVNRGDPVASPLHLIAVTPAADVQLQCARTFIGERFPASGLPQASRPLRRADRIHIAYLSADFREHPVSALTAGLFECHDRSRFRTTAVSFGAESADAMRNRIRAAFEDFVDIGAMSDAEAARHIRTLGVDIAVDLMGFTRSFRAGIMARRAAPIQVNYLGYPGTMGAEFIDYIIADRHAIPDDMRHAYAEKVVHLPDTFQANDRKRPIPDRAPSRSEAGLPETGFVFCCFNQTFKIQPRIFTIWMRLLQDIDGSVAWVQESGPDAMRNLRNEAARRGVSGERIVAAPRVAAYGDHLARLALADLFLDAFPYNAHTTASDVLWAGVPMVSCAGESFASRVALSLLHAVGLPELATRSLDEYERLALTLARDPARRAGIRAKLAADRMTCPLFDTARFTRHLEAGFTEMYNRHHRGEPPRSFAVAPIEA